MLQMMNVAIDNNRINAYRNYGAAINRNANKYTNKYTNRNMNITESNIGLSFSDFVESLMIGFNNLLKTKVALTIITLLIIITVSYFLSGNVSADNNIHYYKYYQTYTVQNGDTLWKIAGKFALEESRSEYIKEVANLNDMSGTYIVAGQKLVIPYYSTEFRASDAVAYN